MTDQSQSVSAKDQVDTRHVVSADNAGKDDKKSEGFLARTGRAPLMQCASIEQMNPRGFVELMDGSKYDLRPGIWRISEVDLQNRLEGESIPKLSDERIAELRDFGMVFP